MTHPQHQQRAITTARRFIDTDIPTVIWDTETTGLYAWEDEICDFAAVDLGGRTLLSTLIRPRNPEQLYVRSGKKNLSAHEVTGLTPEMLADAPLFEAVYPDIYHALNGKRWVIYNAAFDIAFLEQECARRELPVPQALDELCVMHLYAEFYGDWHDYFQSYSWKPLSFAAAQLGLNRSAAHSALADALTTASILAAIAAQED